MNDFFCKTILDLSQIRLYYTLTVVKKSDRLKFNLTRTYSS